MKLKRNISHTCASTLTEALIVVIILMLLFLFMLQALRRAKDPRTRIHCMDNLKEVGLAYKIWADDHNDRFPNVVSITNGGTMELALAGDVESTFQVMSNELSTPKIIVCPADAEHFAATNFTVNFTASNVSYFIGVDATDSKPGSLLSGDDNLMVNGRLVSSGILNLATHTAVWTKTRHILTGNILFSDGTVSELVYPTGQNSAPGGLTNTDRLAIP